MSEYKSKSDQQYESGAPTIGIVAQTLEFNFSSNWITVRSGSTVAYRRCDIENCVKRLTKLGHRVEPIDFYSGEEAEDQFIAREPWADFNQNLVHLRIKIRRLTCTSLLLLIEEVCSGEHPVT